MIRSLSDLPAPEEVGDVCTSSTTCRALGLPFRDFRGFVVAGKAVAMVSRRGED